MRPACALPGTQTGNAAYLRLHEKTGPVTTINPDYS